MTFGGWGNKNLVGAILWGREVSRWGRDEQILGWWEGRISPHPPVGKTLLMKAPLSVSQSVNQNQFFSKTADRIFTKFHTNFWFLKDKKVIPPRKNHFGKKSEISLKVGLFGVGKKFGPFIC